MCALKDTSRQMTRYIMNSRCLEVSVRDKKNEYSLFGGKGQTFLLPSLGVKTVMVSISVVYQEAFLGNRDGGILHITAGNSCACISNIVDLFVV